MGIIQRGQAIWARLSRTQLWRVQQRYADRRGNRLAGATSFYGFLSLFPLIVLAAAIVGSLLGEDAIDKLKEALEQNLPVIGQRIDLDALIDRAGTIGLIAGVSLLLTGLGWVDSMRASIRSMHELDDMPGNMVQRKLVDFGALIGLGVLGLIATGASSVLTALSARIVEWADLEGTWLASWGLDVISVVLGVGAGAILLLYMQTALPRIVLPFKVALIATLAGGILYFLMQKLGNVYITYVIGNNAAYGALALPLALLVWIYLITRAIMYIAAWAKEATIDARVEEPAEDVETAKDVVPERVEEPLLPGPPGKRFKVVPVPQKKADTVAVAAGALLGVTASALAVQLAKVARSVRR